MTLINDYLLPAMWLGYLAHWWVMSTNVQVTEHSESAPSRIARFVLIVCAVALLSLPRVPLPLLNKQFLPHGLWCFAVPASVSWTVVRPPY